MTARRAIATNKSFTPGTPAGGRKRELRLLDISPPPRQSFRMPPKRRAIRAINSITAFGAVSLIYLSLWPGYAGGFVACFAFPLIGLLGVAWAVVAGRLWLEARKQPAPFTLRHVLVAPILVCVTYASLRYYVPR